MSSPSATPSIPPTAAPANAASAAEARTIVGATAVSAIRAREMRSPSTVTSTAAPTTAISIACRYSSRTYALPEPAAARGTDTDTSSSPGASTVRPGPVASSSTRTSRRPADDASVTDAPNTTSGAVVSAAGDALTRFPPSVPVPRVAGDPTMAEASASAVQLERTSADEASHACDVSAPSVNPEPSTRCPPSSATRSIATTEGGNGRRPCRDATTRSVPPATGRASGSAASAASASSSDPADANERTLIELPPAPTPPPARTARSAPGRRRRRCSRPARPAPASSAGAGRGRRMPPRWRSRPRPPWG